MPHKASYPKLFEPPNFLEMSAVSVEILENGVRFLTVRNTKNGLIPDKFGFISIEDKPFSGGEIIKREPLVKALVDIQKKTKVSFVKYSVPEDKTYIFKIHLPKLKTEEIYDILSFKLEENIPLSSKEAVFDYDILPSSNENAGLDLVVSASPLKFIEDLQDLFRSAGLTPLLFSPESNNVAKAVVKNKNEQTLLIVNIKEVNTVLSLVVSGSVYQTSSINLGSSTLNDLLVKYYKISVADFMKIKKEKLYVDNQDSSEVFLSIVNTVSVLRDEIQKYISYCNGREDIKSPVDRIILCGQDSMIVGLNTYLTSNLGLPVEIADVWSNNFDLESYIPEINRLESLNYAALNGLNLP